MESELASSLQHFLDSFFFKSFGYLRQAFLGKETCRVELPVDSPVIGPKAASLRGATWSVPPSGCCHQKPYPPQGESNLTPFPT